MENQNQGKLKNLRYNKAAWYFAMGKGSTTLIK